MEWEWEGKEEERILGIIANAKDLFEKLYET